MGKRILVVDDEHHILELIQFNLEVNGFDVLTCDNGEDAVKISKEEEIDLIILDLMLPGINGIEVCKMIREKYHSDVPIIMLTAKGEERDKIQGLEIGADDYITKPFSIGELIARIKAVLRRTEDKSKINDKVIKVKNIVIDTEKHEVQRDNEILELTLKEFELLKMLALNRGKVLSRDVILDKIWGYEYYGDTRTVDVHIRHLRKKIGDTSGEFIETVRGVGYKMR
ncbi:two-component system, OmpR family, alkaline phosphatase synthesis response regulator PhoP [Caminicella sporogenes DSM 14501]|uniref:Stage 0 sporulation protein A homolog n=1 Tax=Caminicella sporogenes DSM 14501 TaxID=1121266 RepID=A0A1M6SN58_9FIRM|nr:response regulator transcription factor [Caminicella sporogenes]RKD26550.1 DNA-binding response regulator [Caminicella sporogenes]WIF95361.1 response regulator transcription factor [Caminicella sporogenes]SHK46049.1 two-component system, OmpR family, alkaline phosphatase synthesis response regulator PhoP [Caminicella sporogenes DSM 14501]